MQTFTEEQRQQILDRLGKAGVRLPCPRCGNQTFRLIGGYALYKIQTDLSAGPETAQSIPTAVTACERCGFLSQHALGILGLLNQDAKKAS